MRSLILLAACVALSGCLGFGRKEKVETVQAPEIVKDCYTVDLFTEVEIEQPRADVPKAYRGFLGEWGKGAWNDVWCHDLLITKVYADGRAELFEMHAPYEPWGQPATAFKRVGRIGPEGNLRFAYGTETVSYRIAGGQLVGKRSGMLGNLEVALVRRDVPPIPVPRLASRDASAPSARPAPVPAARLVERDIPPIPLPRPLWLVQAQATAQPRS